MDESPIQSDGIGLVKRKPKKQAEEEVEEEHFSVGGSLRFKAGVCKIVNFFLRNKQPKRSIRNDYFDKKQLKSDYELCLLSDELGCQSTPFDKSVLMENDRKVGPKTNPKEDKSSLDPQNFFHKMNLERLLKLFADMHRKKRSRELNKSSSSVSEDVTSEPTTTEKRNIPGLNCSDSVSPKRDTISRTSSASVLETGRYSSIPTPANSPITISRNDAGDKTLNLLESVRLRLHDFMSGEDTDSLRATLNDSSNYRDLLDDDWSRRVATTFDNDSLKYDASCDDLPSLRNNSHHSLDDIRDAMSRESLFSKQYLAKDDDNLEINKTFLEEAINLDIIPPLLSSIGIETEDLETTDDNPDEASLIHYKFLQVMPLTLTNPKLFSHYNLREIEPFYGYQDYNCESPTSTKSCDTGVDAFTESTSFCTRGVGNETLKMTHCSDVASLINLENNACASCSSDNFKFELLAVQRGSQDFLTEEIPYLFNDNFADNISTESVVFVVNHNDGSLSGSSIKETEYLYICDSMNRNHESLECQAPISREESIQTNKVIILENIDYPENDNLEGFIKRELISHCKSGLRNQNDHREMETQSDLENLQRNRTEESLSNNMHFSDSLTGDLLDNLDMMTIDKKDSGIYVAKDASVITTLTDLSQNVDEPVEHKGNIIESEIHHEKKNNAKKSFCASDEIIYGIYDYISNEEVKECAIEQEINYQVREPIEQNINEIDNSRSDTQQVWETNVQNEIKCEMKDQQIEMLPTKENVLIEPQKIEHEEKNVAETESQSECDEDDIEIDADESHNIDDQLNDELSELIVMEYKETEEMYHLNDVQENFDYNTNDKDKISEQFDSELNTENGQIDYKELKDENGNQNENEYTLKQNQEFVNDIYDGISTNIIGEINTEYLFNECPEVYRYTDQNFIQNQSENQMKQVQRDRERNAYEKENSSSRLQFEINKEEEKDQEHFGGKDEIKDFIQGEVSYGTISLHANKIENHEEDNVVVVQRDEERNAYEKENSSSRLQFEINKEEEKDQEHFDGKDEIKDVIQGEVSYATISLHANKIENHEDNVVVDNEEQDEESNEGNVTWRNNLDGEIDNEDISIKSKESEECGQCYTIQQSNNEEVDEENNIKENVPSKIYIRSTLHQSNEVEQHEEHNIFNKDEEGDENSEEHINKQNICKQLQIEMKIKVITKVSEIDHKEGNIVIYKNENESKQSQGIIENKYAVKRYTEDESKHREISSENLDQIDTIKNCFENKVIKECILIDLNEKATAGQNINKYHLNNEHLIDIDEQFPQENVIETKSETQLDEVHEEIEENSDELQNIDNVDNDINKEDNYENQMRVDIDDYFQDEIPKNDDLIASSKMELKENIIQDQSQEINHKNQESNQEDTLNAIRSDSNNQLKAVEENLNHQSINQGNQILNNQPNEIVENVFCETIKSDYSQIDNDVMTILKELLYETECIKETVITATSLNQHFGAESCCRCILENLINEIVTNDAIIESNLKDDNCEIESDISNIIDAILEDVCNNIESKNRQNVVSLNYCLVGNQFGEKSPTKCDSRVVKANKNFRTFFKINGNYYCDSSLPSVTVVNLSPTNQTFFRDDEKLTHRIRRSAALLMALYEEMRDYSYYSCTSNILCDLYESMSRNERYLNSQRNAKTIETKPPDHFIANTNGNIYINYERNVNNDEQSNNWDETKPNTSRNDGNSAPFVCELATSTSNSSVSSESDKEVAVADILPNLKYTYCSQEEINSVEELRLIENNVEINTGKDLGFDVASMEATSNDSIRTDVVINDSENFIKFEENIQMA